MIDIAIHFTLLAYNVWEVLFAVVGVAGTAYGLKEIWFNQKQQQSLQAKMGLSLFYLFHIAAIFFAAGIFGEALLGATFSTLLVSITSLINDSYDYFQERLQKFNINKKIDKLQKKLASNNIDFEQNSFFFEDIMDRQDEIECLQIQQEELLLFLGQISNHQGSSQAHINIIREVTAAIKERCESMIDENVVIGNFKKVFTKSKVDEYLIIQKTNKEIKELNEAKLRLQHENPTLPSQGNVTSEQDKKAKKRIEQLKVKIKQLAIINQHFYKIKKAKDAKEQVQQQLKMLDQKYQLPPFDEYTADEIVQLKALETDYLQNRIRSLNGYLRDKAQVGTRSHKVTSSNVGLIGYQSIATLGPSANTETLVSHLELQAIQINSLLQEKQRQLAENQRYLQLISINPNEQLPQDLNNILIKARKLIKYQNRLELTKVEKVQKLSATRYSLLSAALAIVMCYSSLWIYSALSINLMRFVGVIAGLTSIKSFINTRRTQRKIQSDKARQLNDLIDDCRNRANDVKVPQLQKNAQVKMSSIINKLEIDLKNKQAATTTEASLEIVQNFLPNFKISLKSTINKIKPITKKMPIIRKPTTRKKAA